MASPVTHICLMERVFDTIFSQYDKKLFMLGVTLPDIRYITKQKREETHYDIKNLAQILKTKNALEAGIHYHLYCDYIYENYMPKIAKTMPRKFCEDKRYWEKISWEFYKKVLQKTNNEELRYATNTEIQKRHEIILLEIENKPSNPILLQIATPLGIPQNYMQKNLDIEHYFETFPETSHIINTIRTQRETILHNPKKELKKIILPHNTLLQHFKEYFEEKINQ